jgi:hypothetical protein
MLILFLRFFSNLQSFVSFCIDKVHGESFFNVSFSITFISVSPWSLLNVLYYVPLKCETGFIEQTHMFLYWAYQECYSILILQGKYYPIGTQFN